MLAVSVGCKGEEGKVVNVGLGESGKGGDCVGGELQVGE